MNCTLPKRKTFQCDLEEGGSSKRAQNAKYQIQGYLSFFIFYEKTDMYVLILN